jgi:hypothetical protein
MIKQMTLFSQRILQQAIKGNDCDEYLRHVVQDSCMLSNQQTLCCGQACPPFSLALVQMHLDRAQSVQAGPTWAMPYLPTLWFAKATFRGGRHRCMPHLCR